MTTADLAATGASMAFAAISAVHLLLCAIYLWRKLHLIPAPAAKVGWRATSGAVTLASAMTWNRT